MWHEVSIYTEEERLILELTESVTRISQGGVSDDLYNRLPERFSEKQSVDLVVLINTINSWNRLGISMDIAP